MRSVVAGLFENFVVFDNRNLRMYLGGQMIVQSGMFMQSAAQAWVMWELTRSPAALTAVGALQFVPTLVLGPIAGSVADRVDRRMLLLTTQSLMMALAIGMTLLVATGTVQPWHIYLLAISLGTLAGFSQPTTQAFLGDLAGLDRIRQAIGVNMASFQVGRMLGPAAAGWVIGATGAATAFGANAVSFLAIIGALLAIRSPASSGPKRAAGGSFGDALRHVRDTPAIQNLLLFNLLVSVFGMSVMQVMPAIADDVLAGDAQLLGYLMGASGLGALIGALFLSPIAQRFARVNLVQAGGVLCVGLIMLGVGLSRDPLLTTIVLVGEGAIISVILAISQGLNQILAPPRIRARMIALALMVTMGSQPLAALVLGFSAQTFGTANAVVGNGVILVSVALLILLFRRSIRDPIDLPAAPSVEHRPAPQAVLAKP